MKYLKYTSILLLAALSFYFTDKIMIYMENKNPIMEVINSKEELYTTNAVNAVIEDNTIIPGINGKKIDKRKSLMKMDDFGSFNEIFIIYKEIKPDISLIDNLDKTIIKGNTAKRAISFILEENSSLENYFEENKIKYTIIAISESDLEKEREYINGETSKEKASDLNSLLNKNKVNSKICLKNYSNLDYCTQKKYFIVDALITNGANINQTLSNINSGSIILIKKNTSLANFKLILSEIRKQDLKIIYLSELISEGNIS